MAGILGPAIEKIQRRAATADRQTVRIKELLDSANAAANEMAKPQERKTDNE